MTERIAIIDLGSNSARLIVMHIYVNGAYNLVYHQKETVRLGEGVYGKGVLRPEAMLRAVETMELFSHMCQLIKVDKILAVATAAVRNTKNGPDLLTQIEEQTGIAVQVVSGREEARLGYLGVVNTTDVADAVLFDLGGGSTELMLINNRKLQKAVSLPFGAVNLTEMFGTQDKIGEAKLAELSGFIMHHLNKVPWLVNLSLPIIGVGGTARNVAKMDQKRKNYPFNKVHNYRLGDLSFNDLWRALVASDLRQRQKFPGLSSERGDIIVAGTTLIKGLFDVSRGNRLIVSGCGVREGLFWQYYLSHTGQPEIVADPLLHSTENMLLFYKGDVAHASHVATLAEAMFDGWQALHEFDERDKTLLRVASLLHDIGITINYYDHSRHSAYLVENARLFGLTHREQMMAAVVAGWHHGPSGKFLRNKLYSEFLDETDWQKARKLALLLALAESLDTTQTQAVRKVAANHRPEAACLDITINSLEGSIELQEVSKHGKWFKKEFGLELSFRNV
ncbi:MAG: Ppx/GppA phosphatase family protein [Negativicutes bacterium]|nr:Ppx/GppA phosphatase family protein [Negativicutes bacterium]